MPRTNRVACRFRAATVSEAHTVLNSKQHPLKRPRVGLGSQKRQSRAVQKGKRQDPTLVPLPGQSRCLSDTQGGLCHPRFSQHGAATELEPWKAYRSLASLRLWWPSGLGCSLRAGDRNLGLMHAPAPGWPSLSPLNRVYLHTTESSKHTLTPGPSSQSSFSTSEDNP